MATSSIVARSASMLDIICGSAGPLRFTQAVSRSGLPKSSAHRILAILLDERLVAFDVDNQAYRPGPRLIDWASNLLSSSDLPSLAAAELDTLNQLTDSHVCLSVLQGDSVLFLKTVDSHEPYRLAPRIGECSPIHCTAAGKAMAANLRPARLENLLDKINFERFTEHTIVSRSAFQKDLERIRRRGFAVCDREEFLQISGIAAPVLDHDGEVVAAVSLWNVKNRQSLGGLLACKDHLLLAANNISRRLGFRTGI